jgi:hypothetical protein
MPRHLAGGQVARTRAAARRLRSDRECAMATHCDKTATAFAMEITRASIMIWLR